jgi:hypothetical protein
MRTIELFVGYLIAGGIVAALLQRGQGKTLWQVPLLVLLWPVLLPFSLAPSGKTRAPRGLPDRLIADVRARLDRTAQVIRRIDEVLARPVFDEQEARRRLAELADDPAARAVEGRLRNIERLRTLKARCTRELEEARELFLQLESQRELFEVVGDVDDAGSHLITELQARLDALDALTEGGLS